MATDIKDKQINRKRKRIKAKRAKKIRLVIFGVFFAVILSYGVKILLDNNIKARAESAKIITDDKFKTAENYEKYTEIDDIGFSDLVISFKKTNSPVPIYEQANMTEIKLFDIKKGTYVRYMGEKDGWAKIAYKNLIGYVNANALVSLEENQLVVRKGILLAGKNYLIPDDFNVELDVDVENSLLVMLEAMDRAGLSVEIGRKARSYEQERDYFYNLSSEDADYDQPNEYNSELRTGNAVEIYAKNTDPRLDTDFLNTEEGKWLQENSYKYGFILRYPEEKQSVTGFVANSHIFKFVGTDNAKKMYERQITVEEYFK